MTSGAPRGDPPELSGNVFIRHLGSGGFADVFLYEQQPLGLKIAVKVLRATDLTPELTERFSQEAALMAQLQHRHIAQVMGSGTSGDGRPYIVMKYYSQPNLAVRAKREHFTVTQVLRMGVQLASAVETAHRAGILHRDIKPHNVLTDQYGDIGLTDFGLASRGVQPTSESDGVSVPWSPSEVLYASDDADERSDVFALSATLWHLLTGRSPFEIDGGDNSTTGLMRRIRAGDISPMTRGDVPGSLIRVLHWGMATKQAARPDSALAFARSLQAIEIERKLTPTPLLLLDEPADSETPIGEHTTTLTTQRPQAIAVPPPATPQTTGPAPLAVEVPRPRPGPRPRAPIPAAPTKQETELRTPRADAPIPPPAVVRGNRRSLLVVALTTVVAVIVVIAAVLATHNTGGPNSSAASGSDGDPDALIGSDLPPDPVTPTVTAKSIGSHRVRFTWTYNRIAGDVSHYTITESGGKGNEQTTRASSVTVSTKSGAACIELFVVRKDGHSSDEVNKCKI